MCHSWSRPPEYGPNTSTAWGFPNVVYFLSYWRLNETRAAATCFPLLVLLWLAQCAWEQPGSRTELCLLYSPCTVMSCSHAGPAIIWSGRSSKHVFPLLIKQICSSKCALQKCWLPLGVAQGVAIGKAGVFEWQCGVQGETQMGMVSWIKWCDVKSDNFVLFYISLGNGNSIETNRGGKIQSR